jgi:hypothetical protein
MRRTKARGVLGELRGNPEKTRPKSRPLDVTTCDQSDRYPRFMKKSPFVETLVFGTPEQRAELMRYRRIAGSLGEADVERALVSLAALTRTLIERLESACVLSRGDIVLDDEPHEVVVQPAVGYRGVDPGDALIACVDCGGQTRMRDSYLSSAGKVCAICHEKRAAR